LRQRIDRAGGKILVVTSATGAEGKSVTAVNLSLALAASTDGRVLLIDGDLRLPQVAERLNLNPEKGLGDWLENPSGKLEDYVVHTGGLEVISGGLKPTDPVAALNSPQMREILAQLRQVYNYVVIDSPPVVPVADSHVLAELGDRILVVVRAGRTRPELVERALESVGTSKIAGLVLNGLDYAASPYAYAYRYYQQHYLGRT
jgi:capsular exopolysaccharide synthesis family protein